MEWWKVLSVIFVSILMGAATWQLCKIAEAAGYHRGQQEVYKEQIEDFEEWRKNHRKNHIDIRG
jgi:hypothetical protein